MQKVLKKLTSRKFVTAVVGMVTGISLIVAGDRASGVATLLTSAVAYCVAEGIVDAAAVKSAAQAVSSAADGVEE